MKIVESLPKLKFGKDLTFLIIFLKVDWIRPRESLYIKNLKGCVCRIGKNSWAATFFNILKKKKKKKKKNIIVES